MEQIRAIKQEVTLLRITQSTSLCVSAPAPASFLFLKWGAYLFCYSNPNLAFGVLSLWLFQGLQTGIIPSLPLHQFSISTGQYPLASKHTLVFVYKRNETTFFFSSMLHFISISLLPFTEKTLKSIYFLSTVNSPCPMFYLLTL